MNSALQLYFAREAHMKHAEEQWMHDAIKQWLQDIQTGDVYTLGESFDRKSLEKALRSDTRD